MAERTDQHGYGAGAVGFEGSSTMYGAFFGNYLVREGVISREQLEEALEFQARENLPIGSLCVERNMLTAEQVEKVLLLQRASDRRFGEIAREMGWWRNDVSQELLTHQASRHVYLGEALLRTSHISSRDLNMRLEKFHILREIEAMDLQEKIQDCAWGTELRVVAETARRFLSRAVCGPVRIVAVDEPEVGRCARAGECYRVAVVTNRLESDKDLVYAVTLFQEQREALFGCHGGQGAREGAWMDEALKNLTSAMSRSAAWELGRHGTPVLSISIRLEKAEPEPPKPFHRVLLSSPEGPIRLLLFFDEKQARSAERKRTKATPRRPGRSGRHTTRTGKLAQALRRKD